MELIDSQKRPGFYDIVSHLRIAFRCCFISQTNNPEDARSTECLPHRKGRDYQMPESQSKLILTFSSMTSPLPPRNSSDRTAAVRRAWSRAADSSPLFNERGSSDSCLRKRSHQVNSTATSVWVRTTTFETSEGQGVDRRRHVVGCRGCDKSRAKECDGCDVLPNE